MKFILCMCMLHNSHLSHHTIWDNVLRSLLTIIVAKCGRCEHPWNLVSVSRLGEGQSSITIHVCTRCIPWMCDYSWKALKLHVFSNTKVGLNLQECAIINTINFNCCVSIIKMLKLVIRNTGRHESKSYSANRALLIIKLYRCFWK